MPWWTWLSLAILVGAGVVCAIVAGVLALRTLRAISSVQADLLPAFEQLTVSADALAVRAEHTSARAEELERRFADVQRSAERLAALRWAIGDSLEALTRLRQALPRK